MESDEVLYWKKKKKVDEELLEQAREQQEARFGFARVEGDERTGWLLNMQPTTIEDKETGITKMAIDYYFMQDDGSTFKVTVPHCPYFYLDVKEKFLPEVEAYLRRKYEGVQNIQAVDKEDLEMPNHLNGLRKRYLKISFHTVKDLLNMRKDLVKIIDINRKKKGLTSAYDGDLGMRNVFGEAKTNKHGTMSVKDHIIDIREADVPYYIRCAIDHGIRVGLWYDIVPVEGGFELRKKDDEHRPEPRVVAFDIETTKLPLKFPDPDIDRVMMISYMLDGQGYLIINREIITEDIDDFEYTPKPEYPGPFIVWNEPDEVSLLRRFFDHMKEVKPNIYVTFNGDYFDWPFVERRAEVHGISMFDEIGMCDKAKEGSSAEYRSRFASHMDAFKWVKRDSYLPQGSHGLKAVTKAKLGYDPLELDPEEMVPLASRDPQKLASYSVSDAVCTYYLYMQYVHPFIFSLCNILPMNPDDVLRKGSGTLCETLLMVEAFVKNIIYPNKQESDHGKTFKGHLLESETYIGGHVECLESGVFRKDLPIKLRINKKHIRQLIDDLEGALEMELEVNGLKKGDVSNFDAVRDDIASQLESLLSLEEDSERVKEKEEIRKKRSEASTEEPDEEDEWLHVKTLPVIMHLDVAAMYPNIILTNRLQPSAIVTPATCAVCDFNKPGASCQRKMNWTWKGEYIPASRTEYELVKSKLETEWIQKGIRLPEDKQRKEIKKRLKQYSQAVYKKQKIKEEEEREAIICQRENPFYVDTVRAFRDRRYTYKNALKVWQGKLKSAENAQSEADVYTAKGRVILYDSLQLAHKCILNSFYGYVMRRGARWYSMEMAGVVTHTGAQIITQARQCVEKLGRPLELDTDGIWCALPELFPMTFDFKIKASGKSHVFMYPCTMLNKLVADHFTNQQYHITDPDDPDKIEIKKECSVLFEGDGPYKAMILPASKEEGKLIKKRYAVFDKFDRLVELKGFEVKRRGELRMIKVFQAEVFEKFLDGKTLEDCYAAVGKVANDYLDLLYNKGSKLPDEELLDLISESRNMSKTLAEYGTQKSTSITTAKRLGEFLGLEMIQEKGITCKYIIAKQPAGAQVTDRAVPVKIFASEVAPERRQYFLRKWCQDERMSDFSIRGIIDWDYYIERLAGTIQKIITIPAALQNVENPVPRVVHPPWLIQRLKEHKQTRISNHFFFVKKIGGKDKDKDKDTVGDIEDGLAHIAKGKDDGDLTKFPPKAIVRIHKRVRHEDEEEMEEEAAQPVSPQKEPERKKTKGKSKADEEREELEKEDPTPEPNPDEDWAGWLRWKKRQWKRMRALRKLRRREGGSAETSTSRSVSGGSVVSYMRRQRAALLEGTWEIIEIRPLPNSAHHFRLWVLVGDALHSLTLEVPRLYYINYKKAPSPEELPPNATKVERAGLPRNTEVQHLYQVHATEMEYQGMLLDLESRQNAEGIYETQTPLLFRALVHAGALCRLTTDARKQRRYQDGDIFSLLELDFVSPRGGFSGTAPTNAPGSQQYLNNKTDRYHTIFFYCSFSRDGKRGVMGIFPSWAPPGSNGGRKQGHILVLHPYSRNVVATTKGMEKRLADKLAERDHDVQRFTSTTEAMRFANRKLKEYKDQAHKPTILITQTAVDEERIESYFPSMREFPRATIPSNERDNHYPALAWEEYAADVLITRLRNSTQWWESQIGMCNYTNVPIGNMNADFPVLLSDIIFARMLKRDNQVLWAAESERPDFAGKECDDNFFDSMATTDEMLYPEIVTPDCYSCICAELNVHSLAMNTVLESNRIHEIEGTASDSVLTFSFTGDSVLAVDEASGCGRAFGVLKALLGRWSTDYNNAVEAGASEGHRYPDVLITHFYRWLSNTRSLLYDPALHRYVQLLMRKVFLQLINQFKQLGGKIVYATFNKVIICTNKSELESAEQYVNYVLGETRRNPLFMWLDLEARQYWATLLFKDRANFGGIPAVDKENEGEEMASDENSANSQVAAPSQGGAESIISHWNMAEFLPVKLQDHFIIAISSFIASVYKNRLTHFKLQKARKTLGDASESTHGKRANILDQRVYSEEDEETPEVKELKEIIPLRFMQKLFTLVQDIKKINVELSEDQKGRRGRYQSFAISKAIDRNPTLEFVKFVCHAMSIDKTLRPQVEKLRKNLLKLISVMPFSQEAQYQEPCQSFRLPVICAFCSATRDVDLLRDADLLQGDEGWRCAHCKHGIDKEEVETRLVSIFQKHCLAYQFQDLACKKCKTVKADLMGMRCKKCSTSEFGPRISPAQFRARMRAFLDVAEVHQFDYLRSAAEEVLYT